MILKRDTVYAYSRLKHMDGRHRTKTHLLRTDWRRESPLEPPLYPPSTTICGVAIYAYDLNAFEQVWEEYDMVNGRTFDESDDCKTCCRALESGTLGWLLTT